MRTIGEALETFKLNGNYTHEQLEKAYNTKLNSVSSEPYGKKEEMIREQIYLDYQLLIVFEYVRDLFKDIDLEKKKVYHLPKDVEEFYSGEPYCTIESQLFASIKEAMDDLDAELDYASTVHWPIIELENFKKAKDECYRVFINSMLYGKNDKVHHEIINNQDLEKIVSMKELLLSVHAIAVSKNNMINDIKQKLDEQCKPKSTEYSTIAKHYINMKLAKSYEETKKIYENINAEFFAGKEEIKKTSAR